MSKAQVFVAVVRVPWISPDHLGLRPIEPSKKKSARGTAL